MKIIAASRNKDEFLSALNSDVDIIFMLTPNIADINNQAKAAHELGKKLFIHLDLAEGIGKDEYGIRFAKQQGVDGIISTRSNII
jgi:glycerol uptake operon antiterminator